MGYSHGVTRVRHDLAIKPPLGSEASNTTLTVGASEALNCVPPDS